MAHFPETFRLHSLQLSLTLLFNVQSPTNSESLTPQTPAEKRLLWMIRDLVAQGCTDERFGEISFDGPTPVFSQFIGKYAEAIALLAEYGLVTGLTDNGGRVVSGELLSLAATAEVLKTGPFRPTDEVLQSEPEIGDHLG